MTHPTTGLNGNLRSEIQQQWMIGEVPVIVATISFGMGVDKADVRLVGVLYRVKGQGCVALALVVGLGYLFCTIMTCVVKGM